MVVAESLCQYLDIRKLVVGMESVAGPLLVAAAGGTLGLAAIQPVAFEVCHPALTLAGPVGCLRPISMSGGPPASPGAFGADRTSSPVRSPKQPTGTVG